MSFEPLSENSEGLADVTLCAVWQTVPEMTSGDRKWVTEKQDEFDTPQGGSGTYSLGWPVGWPWFWVDNDVKVVIYCVHTHGAHGARRVHVTTICQV